ncbi:Site-specific recombinase, phage integrase family domain protein [Vibrio chagasii]|nr:Site-specific recombinase, phage integrase family domain protein [Vibrio chagasii]
MRDYNKIISNIAKKNDIKHEELAVNASHYDTYNDLVNHSNEITGIYDDELDSPFWLNSDFLDVVWNIDIGNAKVKKIYWNKIMLSDGSRLTEVKNKKILDFLKYLILTPNCPVTNGGSVKKIRSVSSSISDSIKLINLILSHDDLLNIGESFKNLNSDFIFSTLIKYCKGGFYHSINYDVNLEKFINTLPCLVKNGVSFETFLEDHPYLSKNTHLLFTSKEDKKKHIENAYKLYINGFYRKHEYKNDLLHQPNYSSVTNAIFGNRIIPLSSYTHIDTLSKYQIKPTASSRQFSAINHYQDKGTISKATITALIYIIEHIPVSAWLAKIEHLNIDPSTITLQRLKGFHDFKLVERTFSLPPVLVLKSMAKAFELNLNEKFERTDLWYPDVISEGEPVLIIDLLYDTILKFTEKTKGLTKNNSSYRKIIRDSLFVSEKLRSLGFNRFLKIKGSDPHEVNSVVHFYKVITGSIYMLTGALNARRVSEFTNLPPTGNLKPENINPWLMKNPETFSDFMLGFFAAKTGVGGEISLRDYVERPTPLIIAKLIYKIEKYNAIFIDKGFCSTKDIGLFNGVAFNNFKLHSLDNKQFNAAISCFCDYIKTPTTVIDGITYRYYILEHELRRFFALLFFWSSDDKNIDSLRHQLAHSDLQHLYNYISESLSGDILNSTKAIYLAHKFRNLKSTDLEKLNVAILNQFGVDSINLTTTNDFMDVYFPDDALDEDFSLNIDSEILIKQSKLEGQIQYLLDNDIVLLEPEFFKNESNKLTFNFVIKVKDLENE